MTLKELRKINSKFFKEVKNEKTWDFVTPAEIMTVMIAEELGMSFKLTETGSVKYDRQVLENE